MRKKQRSEKTTAIQGKAKSTARKGTSVSRSKEARASTIEERIASALSSLPNVLNFGKVLDIMNGQDVSFAVASQQVYQENGKSDARSMRRVKSNLEQLGVQIFETRDGRSLYKPQTLNGQQAFDLALQTCESIRQKMVDLANINQLVHYPEVRIGLILSIAQHLGPFWIDYMRRKFEALDDRKNLPMQVPHIVFKHQSEAALIEELLTYRLDFFIFNRDLRGISDRIERSLLPWITKPLGLTFLYERDGKHPFPQLVEFLQKGARVSSVDLLELLQRYPVMLMTNWRIYHDNPEVDAFFEAFCAGQNRMKGQRLFLSTYKTIREYVQAGLGIGIGHKPSDCHCIAKVEDSSVYVGRDPGYPDNLIAFIEPTIIDHPAVQPSDWKPVQFAAYFRKGSRKAGSNCISTEAKFVFDCLRELLSKGHLTYGLQCDSGNLLHDFHTPVRIPLRVHKV